MYNNYEEKFFNIIPKHRKRKSKKNKKANHKHEYKKYIGYIPEYQILNTAKEKFFLVETCIYCDKIGKLEFWVSRRTEDGYYKVLNNIKEIKKLHPDLEVKTFEKMPW